MVLMKKIILIISLFFGVVVAEDLDPKKLAVSCDNGDIDACLSLAELYQKACDGGNPGD